MQTLEARKGTRNRYTFGSTHIMSGNLTPAYTLELVDRHEVAWQFILSRAAQYRQMQRSANRYAVRRTRHHGATSDGCDPASRHPRPADLSVATSQSNSSLTLYLHPSYTGLAAVPHCVPLWLVRRGPPPRANFPGKRSSSRGGPSVCHHGPPAALAVRPWSGRSSPRPAHRRRESGQRREAGPAQTCSDTHGDSGGMTWRYG